MQLSRRIVLPMTLMLVAVVGLAACGSDDSSGSGADASSSSSSSTTSSTKAAGTDGPVEEAEVGSLGTILVTTDGMTVYTLTKDGAAVPCTGGCLGVWPPVNDAAGTQAKDKDLPLYTFVQDTAPGDANGDGIESFGGTWNVVKVGAAGAATSPSTAARGPGY